MAKKVPGNGEDGKEEEEEEGPFKSDRRLRGSFPLVDSKIPPSPWPFSPESAWGKQTEAEN